MISTRFLVTMLVLPLFLGGCALSDTGAIDYRKAANLAGPTLPGQPSPRLNLALKNDTFGEAARVVELDSLSIHLKSAFVKDFVEFAPSPARGFVPNGEIAVVANVFELGKGGRDLDFSDPTLSEGRLVYYSDDVAKGQFLNFNNLTVYGPIEYEGGEVAFQLAIFELDRNTEQAKAILGLLADAGKIAFAPSAPEIALLNSLGQALTSAQQDDTEFSYTLQLSPEPGHTLVDATLLEVANYVFVREDDRSAETPWDRLELDPNEGRLHWKAGSAPLDKDSDLYTDNTYFVMEINKNAGGPYLDLSENTYGKFLQKLDEMDAAKAQDLQQIAGSLLDVALERFQIGKFDEAKKLTDRIVQGSASSDKADRQRAIAATEKLFALLGRSFGTDAAGKLKTGVQANGVDPPTLTTEQIAHIFFKLQNIQGLTAAQVDVLQADKVIESRAALDAAKKALLEFLPIKTPP